MWIVLRVVGAIVSALLTASFVALDIRGIKPDLIWSWYALIAFLVFLGFVAWGWSRSEYLLNKHKKRTKILTSLSRLRADGIILQNKGWHEIRHEKDILEQWWKSVMNWQEDVKKDIRKIHPASADNWVNIGTYRVRRFEGVSDSLATEYLSMLSIRLEKLEKYINERTMSG